MKRFSYFAGMFGVAIVCIGSLLSCNNVHNIQLPKEKLGAIQPVSSPLKFSEAKQLQWDTIQSDGFHPITRKLDINALPAIPYDTGSYQNFSQPPEVLQFDYNALPSKDFNIDSLPSQPLDMEVSVLKAGKIVKVDPPNVIPDKMAVINEFGISQGMPAVFISALYKDRSGLLWIGSRNGLYRYDGTNLQDIIPEIAPDEAITGITEDKEGNIWYVVLGKSIGRIDMRKRTVARSNKIAPFANNASKLICDSNGNIWVYNIHDTSYAIIDPQALTYKVLGKSTGLYSPADVQVVEDKDKNIWISSFLGTLKIIEPSTGKVRTMDKTHGLTGGIIPAITMDNEGVIFIDELERISAINKTKGTITQFGKAQNVLPKRFVYVLSFDNDGRLWRNTTDGVDIIEPQKGRTNLLTVANGLADNNNISVAHMEGGHTWVGSPVGLRRIDYGAEVVHRFGTQQIISLMEDNNANLWVATRAGVIIVDAKREYMRVLDQSSGLSNNSVQSFANMGDKMGIATNGGFNIVDMANKTILSAGRKEGVGNDTIYSVLQDKSGMLWITGPSGGVSAIDISKNIILQAGKRAGLSDDNVQDIKQDNNGLIWLGTSRSGVDVIDPVAGTVKYLNDQPGLNDTCNRMMCIDKVGRMWIGTDKGVYVADTKNNTLTNITVANGLSHNVVLSLLPYKDGVIVGTKNKVNIIMPPVPGAADSTWNISLLEGSQNLVKKTNSWATDCITRSGNYLWGDIGMHVIYGIEASKDSAVVNVTGIQVMNQPQYFVAPQNNNQTGNSGGSDSSIKKLPKMSSLGYADPSVYTWDSVIGPYNLPVNLSLPYTNNFLQFHFAEVDFGRQDSVFYSYLLEGIDKNWSNPTFNNFTDNYLNLPPGKYVFKVVSKGWDGKWSEPASFSFTISPPWYKTWWAYLLYALLGIALLRMYIVYRSRKLKRENKLLEEKVSLRTRQLEESINELKTTQTQLVQSEKMASLGELTAGIAHEIQNPLNFVNNFSEVNSELIDELKAEYAKDKMERDEALEAELLQSIADNQGKITHHGKRADSIVKGMLQHSRSSNGAKEPTDINSLADEYLRLAYHGLRAKDKSFNASMKTDFDPSVGSLNVVTQDVGRVILNLITNAFYAVTEKRNALKAAGNSTGYEPTVSVSTKRMDNKITIRVSDNGSGIPQKALDKIFQPFFTTKPTGQGTGLGLSLSYDIVKAHGGEINLETKENIGTDFTITLPT